MDQQPQSPSTPSNEGALKTSEKEIKKSGKVLPIILILVALAGVGFGVYGMFFKPEPTAPTCPACIAENPKEPKKPTEQEKQNLPQEDLKPNTNEDPNNQQADSSDKTGETVSFFDLQRFKSPDYSKTNSKTIYRLQHEPKWMDWYYDHYTKEITDNTTKYVAGKIGSNEKQEINLSSNPTYIMYGALGQDSGGEMILFLLDNGTVEYSMHYDEKGNENKELDIKKFDGLSNIVKLYQAYEYVEGQAGGGYTVIAEDENGYYYDLAQL